MAEEVILSHLFFRSCKEDVMLYQTDLTATKALYASDTGWCDCIYCRNYTQTLPKQYPEAVEFLDTLGLRHDRALEIMEYGMDESETGRIYEAYYPVIGTLEQDALPVLNGKVTITLYRSDSERITYPSPAVDSPYFMAVLSVTLPWELTE